MTIAAKLSTICEQHGVDALYAFGSRAHEIAALVQERLAADSRSAADVDLGVLPENNGNVVGAFAAADRGAAYAHDKSLYALDSILSDV